ncbi:MAG: OPT/YSL family transporter [Myxococcales bacterium]|nr:OPT/YSL family transporter [Myxococcales bacterium]
MAISKAVAEAKPQPTGPALTWRSTIMGFVLAVFLCGINSYLTLSFGVIEEGPTIAALFFFAFFFVSKSKITTTEMVIVATMGSAGGSLGFISNFFAAKVMATGTSYSFAKMVAFSVTSSLVGMVFVIPLRQMLVVKENLPWPGSKATHGVITALVEHGDPKQPRYLLITGVLAIFYVIFNKDGGFGWFPDETVIGLAGLGAYGASIAWSPFAIGGAYLMGFRTCVGFLAGGIILLIWAPYVPTHAAPHKYVWPGIGFLVSTGLTMMAVNWRVLVDSMRSLVRFGSKREDAARLMHKPISPDGNEESRAAAQETDEKPIVSGRTLAVLSFLTLVGTAVVFNVMFGLNLLLIAMLVAIGGFIQNVIATRAQAQTAFNPARVMGILLQGLSAMMGGSRVDINLAGAGMVAGTGAQAGNLTGDMAYGRWFGTPASWQFWTQFATIIPCALVSAWVFERINATAKLSLSGGTVPAPVAKMWAASAMVFDGSSRMPPFAMESLLIAAAVGVVYVLLESRPSIEKWLPSSLGLGLGLVLPVCYDFSFFLGGLLFWIVLQRFFKIRELTLTTVAVGCIVAEGLGGIAKPVLKLLGWISPH